MENVLAIAQRKFILTLNREKKTYTLLFCFQEPFLRFHLTNRPFISEKSPFATQLDHALKGAHFKEGKLHPNDRLLQMTFQKQEKIFYLIAEFFSKKPNFHLTDENFSIIISLNPIKDPHYHFPTTPFLKQSPPSSLFTHSELEKIYEQLEKQTEFERNKHSIFKQVNALFKRAQRILLERQHLYAETLKWSQKAHETSLLQANFYRFKQGIKEITVLDWENENNERIIPLDPKIPLAKQIEKKFHASKKLKLGQCHAEKFCLLAENELQLRQKQLNQIQNIKTSIELEAFCQTYHFSWHPKPSKKSSSVPIKPYHLFYSQNGTEIWVGKSAKNNDVLTFQHANGSDWWLHARDYPGSHVILRNTKGKQPDENCLQDAAELALRFSKNKDKGEVSVTQVKWLKRIKGSPGKVMLTSHKVIYVVPNEEKWRRLKNKEKLTKD